MRRAIYWPPNDSASKWGLTPGQRWTMALLHFGLAAFLVLGMRASMIPPPATGAG